jgi:bifunctional DNase/RNase
MTRRRHLGLVLLCAGALVGAAGRGSSAPPTATGPQEVEVVGLLLADSQPTVVLQGKRDRRAFGMAIGPAEATGIALPLNKITPPRPLTHDLFLTLFGRLKVSVTKVVINDLRDDIYYATLHLSAGGTEMTLDARPSDAIALAVRARAPVYAEDRVFDKAGRAPVPPAPRI